jgi:hypothetical protein
MLRRFRTCALSVITMATLKNMGWEGYVEGMAAKGIA